MPLKLRELCRNIPGNFREGKGFYFSIVPTLNLQEPIINCFDLKEMKSEFL